MSKYFDLHEHSLIRACLKNDRKSQEQLYRRYANEMYSLILAYENDRDAAKDILQEAFIKIFRSLDQYNNQGPFAGWVRRIVVNTAIDHYRKTNGNKNLFVDIEKAAASESENIENMDNLDVKDILSHVKRLPEKARVVFNLFALEGYSHKEIAVKLEIAEGTSKSQFNRARQLLQQWVKVS